MRDPLKVLREIRSAVATESAGPGALTLAEVSIEEVRDDVGAVRIRSALIDGDVWLARTEDVAAELAVDESCASAIRTPGELKTTTPVMAVSPANRRSLDSNLTAMPPW